MRIETLRERIEKANQKIEKKENTIVKKRAQIEKKYNALRKLGVEEPEKHGRYDFRDTENGNDIYWLYCDVDSLQDDIKRGSREIEETRKTIAKYEAQLSGELEKERLLLTELPPMLRTLQDDMVKTWDEWDKAKRENVADALRRLGYREFYKHYSGADYTLIGKTDEEIHRDNVRDAEALIIDLYYRVKDITGEITDWRGITVEQGTHGMAVLNGTVIGKEGRARVESILAGGYNIQRLHVRVLVHEV